MKTVKQGLEALMTGGKTTSSRLLVEAVYLVLAAAISAGLGVIVNNPEMFPGQWVVLARLGLGLGANLLNPKIPNK